MDERKFVFQILGSGEVSVVLVKEILRQAGMSNEEWDNA
jgi:hypothetical protein